MSFLGTLAFVITSQFCTCTLNNAPTIDPDILRFMDSQASLSGQGHQEGMLTQIEDIYSNAIIASSFLDDVNNELRQMKHGLAVSEWRYLTNLTEFNMQQLVETKADFSRWYSTRLREGRRYNTTNMPPEMKRQLRMFTLSATSSNNTLSNEVNRLQASMIKHYSSSQVCLNNGTCLQLEPSLTSIMASSRDPQALAEVWTKWRHASGRPLRLSYSRLIQVLNYGARENGFSDYSVYERESTFFETPELERVQRSLWRSIRPLYSQLHAHVRRKLREFYGSDVIGTDGAIPAHLLGDMWSQHWTQILDLVKPFPEVDDQSQIDNRLRTHTVRNLFVAAKNFFESLGLPPLSQAFWQNSIFVKPSNREMVCHASSMDMFSFCRRDFRVKMCAKPGLRDFRTVHHEMGHIMYFSSYADQPPIFRTGGNGAFHEAIGDTIQLSALTAAHLQRLGLLDAQEEGTGQVRNADFAWTDIESGDESGEHGTARDSLQQTFTLSVSEKRTINSLFAMALEKVAFIPFSYLMNEWHQEVMRGQTTPAQYNRRWWELRLEYQGIRSPVPRSESDFDPGSKYHVISNEPYASYFISYVLQFQMLEALCAASEGHEQRPLHTCDFYGSSEAGRKLRRLLSYGSSIPWQEQLRELTGQSTVSAQPLLRYFAPLHQWLTRENARHAEIPGWQGATINWRQSHNVGIF